MNVISTGQSGAVDAATARSLSQLKETAGKVVGSVFYGTMLKAMRESVVKGDYGHGGRGEEVFSAQLHEILAERAGSTTQGGLGEAIYRSLEAQQRRSVQPIASTTLEVTR